MPRSYQSMKLFEKTVALLFLLLFVAYEVYPQDSLALSNRIKRIESGEHLSRSYNQPMLSIKERMKLYQVPGLSIAIIYQDTIEWAKGFGIKDIKRKEQVDQNTLFQAGSISKPIAAMTALKMVEEGKITLDRNINNYLKSWRIPDNKFTTKKKVTLTNLLNHTGGLTVHGFPGYPRGKSVPNLHEILDGEGRANTPAIRVDFEPGSKFKYSGGGITIMQQSLEDVSGLPFDSLGSVLVFKPIGMSNSTYTQFTDLDKLATASSGHKRKRRAVKGGSHIYPEMAAAGLWTTPKDLAKFILEIQRSLKGKSNKVLSPAMTEQMLTPIVEPYLGMGLFLEKKGDADYFQHGGSTEGFRAKIFAHKSDGYGVVIMTNSNTGTPLINEILTSVALEYNWENFPPREVPVNPGNYDPFLGEFKIRSNLKLVISKKDGRLFSKLTGRPKKELFPLSEDRFFVKISNVEVQFLKDAKGTVTGLSIFEGIETNADKIR